MDERVNHLIHVLDLESCRNTVVGNELIKGLSSGQKKRTAVGVELVTNPRVIFLDEPTSGLDSHTALQLISGPLRLDIRLSYPEAFLLLGHNT
jgi:ABC-type multidrug transport system ATPase subunit